MWFTLDMDNSWELIKKKWNVIGQTHHTLAKYEQMYTFSFRNVGAHFEMC